MIHLCPCPLSPSSNNNVIHELGLGDKGNWNSAWVINFNLKTILTSNIRIFQKFRKCWQNSVRKGCGIIGRWRKACVSHFYWAVTSTQEHLGELKLAKFQAFLSHVINKHRNLPNRLFNAICAHGEIAAPHVWMTKGTKNMLQCTCVMLFLKQTNQELFLLLALQVTTSIFVLSSEAYEKLCTELGKTSLIKAIKLASSVEQKVIIQISLPLRCLLSLFLDYLAGTSA